MVQGGRSSLLTAGLLRMLSTRRLMACLMTFQSLSAPDCQTPAEITALTAEVLHQRIQPHSALSRVTDTRAVRVQQHQLLQLHQRHLPQELLRLHPQPHPLLRPQPNPLLRPQLHHHHLQIVQLSSQTQFIISNCTATEDAPGMEKVTANRQMLIFSARS